VGYTDTKLLHTIVIGVGNGVLYQYTPLRDINFFPINSVIFFRNFSVLGPFAYRVIFDLASLAFASA
jgi:hypothetical protein